jgi:hypothetical protein
VQDVQGNPLLACCELTFFHTRNWCRKNNPHPMQQVARQTPNTTMFRSDSESPLDHQKSAPGWQLEPDVAVAGARPGQARHSRWPHIWRQDVTNQQKDHERPIWCHQSSLHSVSDPVQVRSSPCPKITRKHRKWSVIFRPWGVHTGRICLNWVVTMVPSHFPSASGSNFPPKLGQLVAKVL